MCQLPCLQIADFGVQLESFLPLLSAQFSYVTDEGKRSGADRLWCHRCIGYLIPYFTDMALTNYHFSLLHHHAVMQYTALCCACQTSPWCRGGRGTMRPQRCAAGEGRAWRDVHLAHIHIFTCSCAYRFAALTSCYQDVFAASINAEQFINVSV